MTDNEIIKALECCSVQGHFVCDECPAWINSHCTGTHKDALDLINRQKAELELKTMDVASLENERDVLNEMVLEQRAEIEEIKDERSDLKLTLLATQSAGNSYKKEAETLQLLLEYQKLRVKQLESTKSEAMEDFAVKIKKELLNEAKKRKPCEQCQRDMATLETLELIDRVLREMIEERF